ncbi:MAG TPA: hypothetical protein VM733_00250 [Thermoanaerobaculia bacterium]|nr:hypothetical protein [Thermoanaerobaculia bacterium]
MGILSAIVLSAVTALPPLKPVTAIDLSSIGTSASDVAWLDDDQLLVALLDGGVARVSASSKKISKWLPLAEIPEGSPYPEFVATDGALVVVMGGGKRHFVFRTKDGKKLYAYGGGRLFPRGLAVIDGKAVYMGWLASVGDDQTLKRGVLWTQEPGKDLSETPMHRVLGDENALQQWRLTASAYAGGVVGLADDSVAVMTVAEPNIYRYRDGKLVEILGGGSDLLLLDSITLGKQFRMDVEGRYAYLNKGRLLEDLVALNGSGVAALVRSASNGSIGWELWQADKSGFSRKIPLEPKALGPFGHMRCESRKTRLACVANFPGIQQANKPETAGANPRLLLFSLK